MKAKASLLCNLEVEKLRPEDIPGAVIEKESETRRWTMKNLTFGKNVDALTSKRIKKQLLEK